MRVMLLQGLAEDIPEDYVPPQKLIADAGKMVSDACGVHRMWEMLWLGELRSLDQVVQSGAHCPTVITNSFPEVTAGLMANILKRCSEDRHPPPCTGASRCC